MKKSIFVALVAVFAACIARAVDVTPDMAMTAANAWAERNAAFGAGGVATNAVPVRDTNAAQTILWYQVSMSNGGCLIVAPVTEIEPVLAVLDEDRGEIPAAHPLRALLEADMRSRLRFLKLYTEDSSGGATLLSASPASAENENVVAVRGEWAAEQQAKWRKLGVGRGGGMSLMAAESVGVNDPIDEEIRVVAGFEKGGCLTHWNQSGGIFNLYTPGHAVCGCVATACSALIQFFGTTAGPEGYENTCTYNGVKGKYTTKGGAYNWSILPSNWGGEAGESNSLNDDQRELLGRVAYDAGVCLGMGWTDDESGAFTRDIAAVLRDNFKFKHAALVENMTQDQYHKLIYMQCWAGAPVGMGIKGHAVVACGYGKDSDGVPRARVFMGWGGFGDAWYALPKIDTKSTEGGSTYLSEVINCVITMISFDDDKVVPVCGRLIPTLNAVVECCDVATNANDKAYFGLRISALEPAGVKDVVVHMGDDVKTASIVLGTPATPTSTKTYAFSASALCSWIPDDIVIPLLNAETATTFAEAKEKALASIGTDKPKPILAFSGSWGQDATDAAWALLYDYDKQNVEDFTNKYVVLCTPYSLSSTSSSDGNPSFAVFEPRAIMAEPNKIWSFYNGRLAYWTIGGASFTNDAEVAAAAATNAVVNGSITTYVTGEEITNAVLSVLGAGRTAFLEGVSGISLNVVGSGGEFGAVDPFYGRHDNTYSNGTTIVATAPATVTNDEQNIEIKCAGCLLSSTNSDEVVTNTSTTVTFDPIPNGAYTLTWVWETNAVLITTEVVNRLSPSRFGVIEPGTGWFPFGSNVIFTATGTNLNGQAYMLYSWVKGQDDGLNDNDSYAELGNMLVFKAMRPVTIGADIRSSVKVSNLETFNLKVTNYGTEEGDEVPPTLLDGIEPPFNILKEFEVSYDTETTLVKAGMSAMLTTNVIATTTTPGVVSDGDGVGGKFCLGWMLSNEDGVFDIVFGTKDPFARTPYKDGLLPLSMAGFNPSNYDGITNGASVTLTWLWGVPPAEELTNVFEIVWNDTLSDLNQPDYKTNLVSAVVLGIKGWTKDDLTVIAPTGWIANVQQDADGNVFATLDRYDAALEAAMESCALTIVSTNADGTITVEATIANGLRGFWYVLYGSDDLTTWEAVADGTYESGTPAAQGQGTAENPFSEVNLSITVTPGDSAAGPKRFYKVVSGATSDPLTETP